MNYNDATFWRLFAAIFAVYWRLGHRRLAACIAAAIERAGD